MSPSVGGREREKDGERARVRNRDDALALEQY